MVSSPDVVLLVVVWSPTRMDNFSEGSKLPSLLTSTRMSDYEKTGNYSMIECVTSLCSGIHLGVERISFHTKPCHETRCRSWCCSYSSLAPRRHRGSNMASQGSTTSKHATALLSVPPLTTRWAGPIIAPDQASYKWWVAATVTLSAFLVVMNNAT